MFVESPPRTLVHLLDESANEMAATSTKSANSETDSHAESDSSTTLSAAGSGPNPTQRVCRWSKFVRNLYEMTINPQNARAVGFSEDGLCVEVRDRKFLTSDILQKYFKHKNMSSFIRQLNNYGFKTVPVVMNSSVSHCFAHDCFQRGRIDLLEGVTRRSAGSEAQKIGDRISALRVKESEFDQRMNHLQRVNDELRRQNIELQEENKRLKTNWVAVQDSLKSHSYEQHRQQQHHPSQHQQQHHPNQHQQQRHPSQHQQQHHPSQHQVQQHHQVHYHHHQQQQQQLQQLQQQQVQQQPARRPLVPPQLPDGGLGYGSDANVTENLFSSGFPPLFLEEF